MPPTNGLASGARPVYLATLRASFRIASPPSIIHSPFAPSLIQSWNALMRSPHGAMNTPRRIEGWLTRPRHLAAMPSGRRAAAQTAGVPAACRSRSTRPASCGLCRVLRFGRLRAGAKPRHGSRNWAANAEPDSSWRRSSRRPAGFCAGAGNRPQRSVPRRPFHGRPPCQRQFRGRRPVLADKASAADIGAIVAAIATRGPTSTSSRWSACCPISTACPIRFCPCRIFPAPTCRWPSTWRRLRRAALPRERQAQAQEAPLADAKIRGRGRLPPHRGDDGRRGRAPARSVLRDEGVPLPQDGHRQCLRRRGGSAFFRALFAEALADVQPPFVLHGLEVDGKLRAVTGSSRSGKRLICEFGAIAEDDLAHASPGDFLFFDNIEEACEQGFRCL